MVLFSLLGQGLTLGPLLKRLGFSEGRNAEPKDKGRLASEIVVCQAALLELDRLRMLEAHPNWSIEMLIRQYRDKLEQLESALEAVQPDFRTRSAEQSLRVRELALLAEKSAFLEAERQGWLDAEDWKQIVGQIDAELIALEGGISGTLKSRVRKDGSDRHDSDMANLRTQLLLSHLLLVLLMVIVMVGAIVNFVRLGGSIHRILKDNYASVIVAQDMKETLERQDSAATFFLAGNTKKARDQYEENRRKFEQAYQVEAHNITEPGEQQMANDIRDQFAAYTRTIQKLLNSAPPTSKVEADNYSRYYFSTLEPSFVRLKNRAQDVLKLNEEAINRASDHAEMEAQRATWTAIIVTASAFLLALFFAQRTIRASLMPLRSLARQAEEIGAGHWNQRIELRRTDEIGTLAEAFNRMSEKLREAWQLEEERLHRAERMSDAALESLYDPVIVTDGQGVIVSWNRAAAGLFGA